MQRRQKREKAVRARSSLPFADPLPSRGQFDMLENLLSNLYHPVDSKRVELYCLHLKLKGGGGKERKEKTDKKN